MELRDNKAAQNVNPSAKLGSVCKSSSLTTGTTPRISSTPHVRKSYMFRLHLLLNTHSQEENGTFLNPHETIPSPNTEGGLSGTVHPGGFKHPWQVATQQDLLLKGPALVIKTKQYIQKC